MAVAPYLRAQAAIKLVAPSCSENSSSGNASRKEYHDCNNRTLHELAEMVLLLQETGFIIGSKEAMNLAGFTGWGYVAMRSAGGWAPQSVMRGKITAGQHRALCALRDGNAYQSSVRVVRDALSIPDALAADILAYFFAHEWIERDEPKGWKLSRAGIALLT